MNRRVVLVGLAFVTLAACEKNSGIKVYRVSKAPLEELGPEQQNAMPANAPSPSMPGGMGATQSQVPAGDSSAPQLKWKTPEGWNAVPPSSMRYASFSAGIDSDKIDISVATFAGEGGSDADNVNRWRQQLQLPPMNPDAIATQIVPLKSEDLTFATIDLVGSSSRTIAAWTRRDGRVWFFKATGQNAAIEKEKENFRKFIESIRF